MPQRILVSGCVTPLMKGRTAKLLIFSRGAAHIRNVRTCANGSNIAWSFDHRLDFDNSSVIDKGSSRIRKTLEAWHTSATKHADNNSKPIPNPGGDSHMKQTGMLVGNFEFNP